jgi:hypothetical protein
MMQDGDAASFALHIAPTNALLLSQFPLGWAWSAHVRHSIVLDPTTNKAIVRRWDDATYQEERSLRTENQADKLIRSIESSSRPASGTDVIDRTLEAFKLLRDAIEERHGSSLITLDNKSEVVTAFFQSTQHPTEH